MTRQSTDQVVAATERARVSKTLQLKRELRKQGTRLSRKSEQALTLDRMLLAAVEHTLFVADKGGRG